MDELVKRLRSHANLCREYNEDTTLFDEAADAIEELQQQAEHYHGCMNDWFEVAQEYKAEMPCESCHWDGVIGHDPPNWKGPTNADRIRAMTDEELAEWIYSVQDEDALRKGNFLLPLSKEWWLDWLKEEVE